MKYTAARQKELARLSQQLLQQDAPDAAPEQQIAQLVEVLHYHEWRYYVLDAPVIGDTEYDLLYKQLEALEAAHPDLVRDDSPTTRVGSDLTDDLPAVPHRTPMLSLANTYNADDLRDFDTQVRKLTGREEGQPISYVVEPKYDGGTIALIYRDDRLVRGATRGNGKLGEEMTANARVIKSIPLRAAF